METGDKVFVGNVKEIPTQYGVMHSIGLNKDDLEMLLTKTNERGWVNLMLKKGQSGKHYIEVMPDMKKDGTTAKAAPTVDDSDELDL